MDKVKHAPVSMGCDPEFFFTKGGKVVGSEDILKVEADGVVQDGVQAELNPAPSYCRDSLLSNIKECLQRVREFDCGINISSQVEVDEESYEKLSEDSKISGCEPSKNTHGEFTVNIDKEDRRRFAGGHIHLGHTETMERPKALDQPERLVNMLDVLVGNTCVLLDRDPSNVERRKYYGRAGEYRTPPHGIEYRTLSNFWLKSPVLASLVFGLARHAVELVESDLDMPIATDMHLVYARSAIENNDKQRALDLYDSIKTRVAETAGNFSVRYPLRVDTVHILDKFLKNPPQFGDIFKEWERTHYGINSYLMDMISCKKKK